MKNELPSIPFGDVEVILLLTISGPLNSDATLLSVPPSTLIERLNTPSFASTTFSCGRFVMSSPTTVLTGVSKISSRPVIELNFLLPA